MAISTPVAEGYLVLGVRGVVGFGVGWVGELVGWSSRELNARIHTRTSTHTQKDIPRHGVGGIVEELGAGVALDVVRVEVAPPQLVEG